MTTHARRSSRQVWLAVLVASSLCVAFLLSASAADASSLNLAAGKRTYATKQAPCTTQSVTITSTNNSASVSTLLLSTLDATRCKGLPIAVTLYDPKASATWTSAWKAYGTGTVPAAATTLTVNAAASGSAT